MLNCANLLRVENYLGYDHKKSWPNVLMLRMNNEKNYINHAIFGMVKSGV